MSNKFKKPPYSAFLIREPQANGFTDSFSVAACTVVEVETERARVVTRCGSKFVVEWVPLYRLASNPSRFVDRVAPYLSALVARAPQPAVAVMTATEAEQSQLSLPKA